MFSEIKRDSGNRCGFHRYGNYVYPVERYFGEKAQMRLVLSFRFNLKTAVGSRKSAQPSDARRKCNN